MLGVAEVRIGAVDMAVVIKGSVLSVEQQLALIKPFSKQEVQHVLWSILEVKSPGLDDYGIGFFKSVWKVIEPNVTAVVLEFFKTGKLLRSMSKTNLVLIPKTDVPRTTSDYRSIACCGVLYKCIAKLLCERLKLVLPTLIDPNQAAFVAGHSIIRNVLIGQELVRLYRRQNVSPRVMMKIDIKNVYDSVSWKFLHELSSVSSFHSRSLNW